MFAPEVVGLSYGSPLPNYCDGNKRHVAICLRARTHMAMSILFNDGGLDLEDTGPTK